jgi:YidC/Oxa1 family membrane protein insertase
MDKKNFSIGVALLLAALAALYLAPRSTPPPPPRIASPAPATADAVAPAPGATPAAAQAHPTQFAAAIRDDATAEVTTLRNAFIEARFTNAGGALRDVALLKYPAELGSPAPFVYNALHADPMLAFVQLPQTFPGLDRTVRFERVAATETEVTYRAVLNGRIEILRRYKLSPNSGDKTDPYVVRHETTFRNISGAPLPPARVAMAIGTAAPTSANDLGQQITTGYSTGNDKVFIPRADLEASSGFFGLNSHGATKEIVSPGPLVWTSVKNQFFTSIFTSDQPAAGLVTQRVKLLSAMPDETLNAYGIAGAAQFELKALPADGESKLAGDLYVGPKEYRRLANSDVFKADQDKVMQFGFFKYFSQILLTLMTWIHGVVGNWGVAIILTTLTLKIIFIPFTLAASRSAKRMAKLQPEMQALREKFKDNPQKQQAATMELFKKHKVNPVGGCIPILITIPFFMGFFTMLQSTAELRFAPFLWARDLASEDTIALIFGYPLNIMPLLMGATMVIQMRLTPSPSTDKMQMKMMQFMPFVFTLFCYRFSCALSLYSFINGLFTIGQQLVINRMKDPVEAPAPARPSGKPVKNVTPKKK